MYAVVASTLQFVLAVKSVISTWAVSLTCSRSVFVFHNNPSVVTQSLLSRDNICCISCSSLGMLSKNVEYLEAHFLKINPAVLKQR